VNAGPTDEAGPSFTGETGLTILEVLIALAILSLLTIAATSFIRLPLPAEPSSEEAFIAFVKEARLDLMRQGTDQVLIITGTDARIRGKAFSWDPAVLSIRSDSPPDVHDVRLVFYADGTVSGPQLETVFHGKASPLPLVYRGPP
jgi:hypothetical protein